MRIDDVRRLRGPNVYCSHPVAVALVDLQELTGQETADVPGFTVRSLKLLPGLAEQHCAATQLGGLAGGVTRGTHFGHVLERVTLELSHLIGREEGRVPHLVTELRCITALYRESRWA